jgi:GcrA cell cycle regulator
MTWGRPSPWDDPETVASLVRLAPHYSASHIAEMLGVSRNAVIGKIHRLGLSMEKALPIEEMRRRHKAGLERRAAARLAAGIPAKGLRFAPKKPIQAAIATAPADAPVPLNKPLLDLLAGDCRWPVTDGPYLFCAQPAGDITPRYCPYHLRMAHDRSRDRYEQNPGAAGDRLERTATYYYDGKRPARKANARPAAG